MAFPTDGYVDSVGSSKPNPPTMIRPAAAINLDVTIDHAETTNPLGTSAVRLVADTDCFVLFGESPVATVTNGTRLMPGVPEYFACDPDHKLSVVRAAADGHLNITTAASS